MPEVSNQNPIDTVKNTIATITPQKGWAMSCYIPVFNILTCILTSVRLVNDKFCIFHARQGLVLFALWFLTIIVALVSPMLSLMLWGVVLLLHISGMVFAYGLKTTEIPFISEFASKIPDNFFYNLLTGKKVDPKS